MDVLIVDDEPGILAVMAETARSLRLSVATFTDPVAALKAMPSAQPRVLILDLSMPEMDGIEFIRHIADERLASPKLILVSGYDLATLRAAEKLAAQRDLDTLGSLQKPLDLNQLIERLSLVRENVCAPAAVAPRVDVNEVLPNAIATKQIVPYYQPLIDLKTGLTDGFEALARWLHPDEGLILPAAFIPNCASNGLIGPLTEAICTDACQALGCWSDQHLRTRLSINVSAAVLNDLQLPEQLENIAQSAGVDPTLLTFEITETEVMENLADSLDILTRLKLRRFTLSIDDFGTGYSTMGQLHRFPFGELKIDGSFIAEAVDNAEARAIVETTLMLAQRLGMDTVAEGVETEAQFNLVKDLGCQRAQGFYFSHAMPADAVPSWLAEHEQAPYAYNA